MKSLAMMLALTLVVLPVAAAGQARAVVQPGDSAAVEAAAARFHDALRRGDSSAALALLGDSAIVLESGEMEARAEYRAHHLAADVEFSRAVATTRVVRRVSVAGDAAWVVATTETRGTFRGRAVSSAGAELLVLARDANGWRIVAIHWSSHRVATNP